MDKEQEIQELALQFAIGDLLTNGNVEQDKEDYKKLLEADGDDSPMTHDVAVWQPFENYNIETVLDEIERKKDYYLLFLEKIKEIENK